MISSLAWTSKDQTSSLYHGDAFDVMEGLIPESIDCIWTDPPYGLSNDGTTCRGGKRVSVNKGDWDRSPGVTNTHDFSLQWLEACHRLLKPAGTIWITGTLHIHPSIGLALQQLGFRILNDIIWEKTAPPPNLGCRCFTHATEIIYWATKAPKNSKHKYTFNYELMKLENKGKQMKNVWKFGRPSQAETLLGKHPTQKPVPLISRCLRASTIAGDLVFDPFVGSGSTGVAALELDRRFIGCEQDDDYIDIATARLDCSRPGIKHSN